MAWLEKRGDSFHLSFRLGDQKFNRSLKTTNQTEAETALARVDRRLKLIEDGDLPIPDNADLATFILSDGKLERPVVIRAMTLRELLAKYEARRSSRCEKPTMFGRGSGRARRPDGPR